MTPTMQVSHDVPCQGVSRKKNKKVSYRKKIQTGNLVGVPKKRSFCSMRKKFRGGENSLTSLTGKRNHGITEYGKRNLGGRCGGEHLRK